MDIAKARAILWEKYKEIEDKEIQDLISLLKSLAQIVIDSRDQ